jgi:hypothetical protein
MMGEGKLVEASAPTKRGPADLTDMTRSTNVDASA